MSTPTTRWERDPHNYGEHFARLVADGVDIEGEARLADALVERGARILDAGSGMGRVADALRRRGHRVLGLEKDRELVAQSRATYPDVPVIAADLMSLDAGLLARHGHTAGVDLVILVGNVMVFLAPDTEQQVLSRVAGVLEPEGRVLVGFESRAQKVGSRAYSADEFRADAQRAGLYVEAQWSSYTLRPAGADDYVVMLLSARARLAAPGPTV